MAIKQDIEKCIKVAKDAGCLPEQVKQFLNCSYAPYPWQWKFHAVARHADKANGPVDIGCGGARGPGKALGLDTLIPTATGWTTMGEIKVGDLILSPDGLTTKVTGVSGIQKDRKCYDVIFSDGSTITADAEHLWVTETKKDRVALWRRSEVFKQKRREKRSKNHDSRYVGLNTKPLPVATPKTTEEIKNTLRTEKEINHSIRVTTAIQGNDITLPIHPYVLGVWLGDGHKHTGMITCFDEQIIDNIRACGYHVYPLKTAGTWRIDGFTQILKENGLLFNKHVPSEYLRALISDRERLLCGLNDTDGYADLDGGVEFTNTNKILSEQYFELVASLGIKVTMGEYNATLYGRIISRKWRIRYTTFIPVFELNRKKNRQNIKPNIITQHRFIVEIRDRESVPVQCITVDHSSHCFLVGKSFIPTHNSHAVLSQAALDDCQRVAGLKGLFLRQTGVSAKESFNDLVDKVVRGHVEMELTANLLKFPNESRILLGGFRTESDIDKYIGIEYDFIIVEELNQITVEKYTKLRGSLRTSKPNWRPRMYASFNAGGIGHQFVKDRYVIPYRMGTETETVFIPSTYKENPALNVEYIKYLEGLQGNLGKAWREGDWDIFEGMYFTEWNFDKHTCQPFTIPDGWPRFRSIDPSGRIGVTSCHWYAVDRDGRVYCYREHYATGMDMDEHAEKIAKISIDEKYQYTVMDSAANAKAGYSETGAEIYQRHGIGVEEPFVWSAKERLIGWNDVHQYLRIDKPTVNNLNPQPKLKVFKNCVNMIRTIPLAQHDELHPEDVASIGITFKDGNGNEGTEHQDACFTKDTKIETPIGYILYQKSNGFREVYEFMGSKVTADHPYLTQRGFCRLDELRYSDRIVLWKNKLWTELYLDDTQTHRGLSIGSIFFLIQRNLIAIKENLYTDIYGKNIMVKYLRAFISIIKTIIHLITIYLISNVYHLRNIQKGIIVNLFQNGEKTLKSPENLLINGMEAKKVKNFIVNSQKKIGKIIKNTLKSVFNVVKYIKHFFPQEVNSAILIAELPHLGKEEVFATLTTSGFFTANGIVVSNCDDLRYFLRTLREGRAPKMENAVEKRLKKMYGEEQSYDFNYMR